MVNAGARPDRPLSGAEAGLAGQAAAMIAGVEHAATGGDSAALG